MNSASRLRWLACFLLLSSVVLSGIFWWRMSSNHDQLRTEALDRASNRATQLAELQARHIEALFLGVDQALQQFRNARQAGNNSSAEAIIRTAQTSFPPGSVTGFLVSDARGNVTYFNVDTAEQGHTTPYSPSSPERDYFGDRDYFKFHQTSSKDQLFIGKPVLGRTSGKWAAPVTRPLIEKKRFAGVVLILFSTDYLASVLGKMTLGPDDLGTLLFSDGAYVARSYGLQDTIGKSVPADRPFLSPNSPEYGVFRAAGAYDKEPRIYAWHKLEGHSLLSTIGLDVGTILAPIEQQIDLTRKHSALAIGVIHALIAAIAILLMQAARQQNVLANSAAMLRSTLESTQDGILVVDSEQVVLNANRRFYELWRIPDEIAAPGQGGRLHAYVLDQLLDPEEFQRTINDVFFQDAQHFDTVKFKDGRVFERYTQSFYQNKRRVRLWSFQDITERKRSEMALLESEAKYREVVETSDELITRLDTEGLLTFVNHMSSRYFGLSPEASIGMPVFSFIHPEDRQKTEVVPFVWTEICRS